MPSQRSAPDFSSIAVVIPVKAFHQAKERLSDLLTPAERFVLAKYCADRVVEAARQFETYIVCDDADVAQWARDHKVKVVWQPEVGLNAAVRAGVDFAKNHGKKLAIVSHSDLPLATALATVVPQDPAPTTATCFSTPLSVCGHY